MDAKIRSLSFSLQIYISSISPTFSVYLAVFWKCWQMFMGRRNINGVTSSVGAEIERSIQRRSGVVCVKVIESIHTFDRSLDSLVMPTKH